MSLNSKLLILEVQINFLLLCLKSTYSNLASIDLKIIDINEFYKNIVFILFNIAIIFKILFYNYSQI